MRVVMNGKIPSVIQFGRPGTQITLAPRRGPRGLAGENGQNASLDWPVMPDPTLTFENALI
jgi:hypothetical protein